MNAQSLWRLQGKPPAEGVQHIMQTSPGICQRKRRYATREEADAVALRAAVTLRAYRCALCRHFHLTSRTKGLRVPKAVADTAS